MWTCVLVALSLLYTFCGRVCAVDNIIRPSTVLHSVNQTACKSPRDCGEQQYCAHTSSKEPVCTACRTERRSCQRSDMCCQALQCINGQCKQLKRDRQSSNRKKATPADKPRKKRKGQEMAKCVRSEDCEDGLCCRRYLKGNKCQRIGVEGEACSLRAHSKRPRAVEYCDCARGLSCHAQDHNSKGNGICRPDT